MHDGHEKTQYRSHHGRDEQEVDQKTVLSAERHPAFGKEINHGDQ